MRDDDLDPGELASIDRLDLDETFWWVWISSLAGEEPSARKAVFGRCAFIETDIHGGRWLVMEEQVKGAAAQLGEGAVIAQKKKRFTFGRRDRSQTPTQTKRTPNPRNDNLKRASATIEEVPNVSSEQQAKVQEAAAEIVRQQQEQHQSSPHNRRGRSDENIDSKTASVMTLGLQPVLQKDAGPAMQWARKFDKESIRARYLGDTDAGRGFLRDPVPSQAGTLDLLASAKATDVDLPRHGDSSRAQASEERELPPPPTQAQEAMQDQAPQQPPAQVQEPRRAPSPLPPQTPPKDAPMYPPPEPPAQAIAPAALTSHGHQHKESEKTLVSPNALNHMSRKPVGSIDNTPMDHPALRQQKTPSPVDQPTSQSPVDQRSPRPAKSARSSQKAQPPTTAAAAAAAAWNRPADPQVEAAALRSKKGSTRGFKKLFGRGKKQDEPEPEALAMHRAISSAKLKKRPRGKSDVARKQASQPAVQEHVETATEGQDLDEGEPGPEIASENQVRQESQSSPGEDMTLAQFMRNPGGNEAHRHQPSAQEPVANDEPIQGHHNQNHSVTGFSDFSQGPLEDQPAYAGDDESIPPVPEKDDVPFTQRQSGPQQQHGFQTQTAARLFAAQHEQAAAGHSEAPASGESTPREYHREHDDYPEQASVVNDTEYATPMDAPGGFPHEVNDADEVGTNEENQYTPPARAPPAAPDGDIQDRWAQIRKNAADRRGATEDRVPSAGHEDWRQSQGARTDKTDDGETSGEESKSTYILSIKVLLLSWLTTYAQLSNLASPASALVLPN